MDLQASFRAKFSGVQKVAGLVLALSLVFTSCSSKKLKGEFDSDKWKADLAGCRGERATLQQQVENIRLELIGIKEYQIRSLFGKPDMEELLERSQKKYIYNITPGSKCAPAATSQGGEAVTLSVTINALGKVTESVINTKTK